MFLPLPASQLFRPMREPSTFAPELLWGEGEALWHRAGTWDAGCRWAVAGSRMDTLSNQDIVDADLADWRELAQRLHARFRAGDPAVGAAFVADAVRAAAEAGLADHLEVGLTADPRRPAGRDAAGRGGLRVTRRRRHPGPAAQRGGASTRGHLGAGRGHRGRARPRHRRRRAGSARSGRRCSPATPTPWWTTPSSTPPAGCPRRGSRAPSRTRCPASAGTSTCGWRPRCRSARIAAAVAAGGTVVDDSEAPSFTVLADPDGNKVCVCTCLDRA